MWKVIQGDEKVEFIKDYQDNKYFSDEVTAVDFSGDVPKAEKINWLSVDRFVSDDIVILVKVD